MKNVIAKCQDCGNVAELPESAFLPVRPRCRCGGAMNRTDMPRMHRRCLYHADSPMVEYERPITEADPPKRHCAACKAKLRRANQGDYCSPCKRRHGEVDTTALSEDHRARASERRQS